jgi:predicted dehydrogenase
MPASGEGSGNTLLKVGVVGARTAAQGIGPYVARAFGAAGCQVAAIAGTSQQTVDQARADLAQRFGIEATGYTDVTAMLAAEALDVLAICSPAEVHAEHLAAGLDAGVHVLCEKPLWWGGEHEVSHDALAVSVRALAEGFLDQGRLLALNTQWPYTLPTYRRLHPDLGEQAVERFELLLSPTSTGAQMIVDAGPHLLSLLAAVLGSGTVEAAQVERPAEDALDLHFAYHHAAGETDVTLRLRHCPEQPRPAGYGINGHWADREIEPIGYRMTLCADSRREDLPDPLDLLVADFVSRAVAGEATDVEGLVESMSLLRDLVRVAEDRDTAP